MTADVVALPDQQEIIRFAARIYQGALSEPERADLATLVILLGSGIRSHAEIQHRHAVDQARGEQADGDEFAVLLWRLAGELFASTLTKAPR